MTEMEQEPEAATVPPVRLMAVALAAAVTVPPQVLLTPGVDATAIPAGRASVNATPLRPRLLLGLAIVKVKVVATFVGVVVGEKALLMVGGLATSSVAEAVLPVPSLVELTAPVVFR
jgi:hypothetical protein